MEIGIPVFMFAVFPVKPQVIVMAHTSYIIQMKTAVHASYVYGNKAKDGKLYVCSHFPQCNSYVGVHPGTTNAKGKLANKELRQKRIQAHRVFDQIWLNHIFTKSEAYRWIADKFCLTAKEAHIGEFSTYMCDQLILESMKILENNHIPLRAIG